jgi:hypothetical protein
VAACDRCGFTASDDPALDAHVAELHTSPRAARLARERAGEARRDKSPAPPESKALQALRDRAG